ncbi:MAG: hypothetical protein CVV51_08225 [Spirochaetae bacterium HGW-Spirochaetae-7]|jgi:hypothetical protein|nr:MAG: hypothetical protein CVV51_08225 [Spirochaetae bacterium HGW-Spirochaetae-7]
MGITLAIVGGMVVVSIIAVIGDVVSKGMQSRPPPDQAALQSSLKALTDRVELLERQADERDSRLAQVEGELAFTTKLLEGKHSN